MSESANQIATCRWCGLMHGSRCPSVKAFEFECDGVTVRCLEFFCPNEYRPIVGGAAAPPPFTLPIR